MEYMLIPLAALLGYCLFSKKRHRVMTPAQDAVLQKALASQDPTKLRRAASVFGAEGFPTAAQQLAARAQVPTLPWSTQAARTNVFQQALASAIPADVRAVANAFQNAGLTSAATFLNQQADGLARTLGIPPVAVPVSPVLATTPSTPAAQTAPPVEESSEPEHIVPEPTEPEIEAADAIEPPRAGM